MTYRKVAALYDVHGNLPALEAVLADVEREQPDLIVFGGDLAAGWYPVEVLERVRAVVYGHIHVQGDRGLPRHRLINPGAVGLAYGTNAACWALLGPDAELRQTDYDVNQVVPRLAAAPGWEGAPKWAESRRHPPSAQQALEQFEGQRKQRA